MDSLQISHCRQQLTVAAADFNISLGYGGGGVTGYVRTWNYKLPKNKQNEWLQDWHPWLSGCVWYQQRVYDVRQGIAEMDFTSTPELSPILIRWPDGRIAVEVIKGFIYCHALS